MFAEQGIEAQITDVARDADVGVGTIYRHFPTKEALAAELVRHQFRIFAANARAALDRGGSPFGALAGVMRQNAELCARNVAIQSTLSGAFGQAWTLAREELDELHALTGKLVERAQREGEMRPDIRTDDIPMLMCGVSSTMANTGAPGFDWRRHLELVIDMLRGNHSEG